MTEQVKKGRPYDSPSTGATRVYQMDEDGEVRNKKERKLLMKVKGGPCDWRPVIGLAVVT